MRCRLFYRAPDPRAEIHLIILGSPNHAKKRGIVNRNVALVAHAPRLRSIPKHYELHESRGKTETADPASTSIKQPSLPSPLGTNGPSSNKPSTANPVTMFPPATASHEVDKVQGPTTQLRSRRPNWGAPDHVRVTPNADDHVGPDAVELPDRRRGCESPPRWRSGRCASTATSRSY